MSLGGDVSPREGRIGLRKRGGVWLWAVKEVGWTSIDTWSSSLGRDDEEANSEWYHDGAIFPTLGDGTTGRRGDRSVQSHRSVAAGGLQNDGYCLALHLHVGLMWNFRSISLLSNKDFCASKAL